MAKKSLIDQAFDKVDSIIHPEHKEELDLKHEVQESDTQDAQQLSSHTKFDKFKTGAELND